LSLLAVIVVQAWIHTRGEMDKFVCHLLWTHAQRCFHVIFCRCFYFILYFFMAASVGQTAERIFTKLSHVV